MYFKSCGFFINSAVFLSNLKCFNYIKIMYFETTNGITDKFLRTNYNDYYLILFEYVKEKDISLSERI